MGRSIRATKTARAGNTLAAHPEDIPKNRTWRRITIETVTAGQPRPYADSVDVHLVTFEGGTPSTQEGFDLPFATQGPYKPLDTKGTTVFSTDKRSDKEKVEDKDNETKIIVNALLARNGWTREGAGLPLGQRTLTEFECVDSDDTYNTYRVKIVDPYCD